MANLSDVASMLWTSNVTNETSGERYDRICEQYDSLKLCMKSIRDCNSHDLYDTLSSGVAYMCEERRKVFEKLKTCMNGNLMEVYSMCNSDCNPHALIHGIIWKEIISHVFPFMRSLDNEFSMIGLNNGCNISKCLLHCVKGKYNDRCRGVLGSLLTEVIMRPFKTSFRKSRGTVAWLTWLLPGELSFQLQKHQGILDSGWRREANRRVVSGRRSQEVPDARSAAREFPVPGRAGARDTYRGAQTSFVNICNIMCIINRYFPCVSGRF
ncbi:hypothetical protein L596_000740 [Steinernema carpocapsae]|uniref:Chondroitin proteoglycan 4 domain-containing protein n=1 Tax=Steinernema carpocapsae TaxID=34508 RepID=A0A4U8UJ34_STECR|nr:hypothetical protein L596_000740 [Steinernema carpocapsae]